VSKKKIVLLGAGLTGREHVTLLQKNQQTSLVGISDVTDDAGKYARY